MIEIKNLDVVFGRKPEQALPLLDAGKTREHIREETGLVVGVSNANLRVEKGEICVLMGLSGSGKSSLLRCVNGLNPITRGQVNIDLNGQMVDFATADEKTRRELRMKTISMVFQKFALMPWLSVEKNVAMPLEIQGLPQAEIKRRVDEQLEIVGLSKWAKHKPSQLSGGMQQRVGLARALCTESDILLMDEPFSALDPLIRNQLQDELLQLQERLNKTIIFVSHDLDEALKIGSNIAIMKAGEIVQQGNPQSIVMKPENDYVRDFVQHTNLLNVLRAKELMRLISDLPADEYGYSLSTRHKYHLSQDKQSVRYRDENTPIVDWDSNKPAEEYRQMAVAVTPEAPMREVMALWHHTNHFVFVKQDGELRGVIGDNEFSYALLGQMLDKD